MTIPEAELRKADPALQSFININTPEDLASITAACLAKKP
jgi:molybdopterin-guanine dinucleotide biosynthesis protein A